MKKESWYDSPIRALHFYFLFHQSYIVTGFFLIHVVWIFKFWLNMHVFYWQWNKHIFCGQHWCLYIFRAVLNDSWLCFIFHTCFCLQLRLLISTLQLTDFDKLSSIYIAYKTHKNVVFKRIFKNRFNR